MKNTHLHIENYLFFFLCAISIFTWSTLMVDSSIAPKWYYSCVLLFVGMIILSIKKIAGRGVQINTRVFAHIIVALCTIQALYGILKNLNISDYLSGYRATGSFDNPAGFASCLSVALPFIWFFICSDNRPIFKNIYSLTAFFLIIAVCLSGSRAGIISVVITTGWWWFGSFRIKNRTKIILFTVLLIFIGLGAYFVKKDSADGRILIWKCSWEMVKDSPLFGHGPGGFKAHYMDYQADYLALHSNSSYAQLADMVQHPFNEYLLILVNYGIIGFLCLLIVIGFAVYSYFHKPTLFGKAALCSLLALGVFSLFSYPFTYPFTWIIFIFCLYILFHNITSSFVINRFFSKSVFVLLFSLSIWSLYKLQQRICAEWEWKKIVSCNSKNAISSYPYLAKVLANDCYFLYNYAVVLFENDRFKESLVIARQCRDYWANYELEILLGDICKNLQMYQEAEGHYLKASMMCPCRFHPLNFLFDLYIEIGNEERALQVAEEIIEKPIKVRSLAATQIKNKMKKTLLKSTTEEGSDK